jgi:hypothetical protein
MTQVELDPGYLGIPGRTIPAPPPGEEVAGPALAPFLLELRGALRAELELLASARLGSRARTYSGVASGQTDGSGNAVLPLFEVPNGGIGRLVWATIDEAAVTPATPDTSGSLFHGVWAASASGITTVAAVVAVGSLLDYRLNAPTRGDALIPDVYSYGSEVAAPTLVGPATFYFVVEAANTAKQVACRWTVVVDQPNP